MGIIRTWLYKSLRNRFLAASLSIVCISLVTLGVLAFYVARLEMYSEVQRRNEQLSRLLARDLAIHFDMLADNLRLFSYQLEESDADLALKARLFLELRRNAPLTYRALYLFDATGELILHLSEPLAALLNIETIEEITNRPAISVPSDVQAAYTNVSKNSVYISPVCFECVDLTPVLYMAIPLQSPAGQVVVAEIDLRDTWRQFDAVHMGQTGQVFIVSEEGIIIAHPERAYIGQTIDPALRPVLAGYVGQARYTDANTQRVMLAAYTPVSLTTRWGLVVEQAEGEVLSYLSPIISSTLFIVFVASILTLLISLLVTQSIVRPLRNLACVTQDIARTGNLNQQLNVKGEDEIAQLAHAFNQMIISRRESDAAVHKLNALLELRVAERTSELASLNEDLQELIYVASHDLRTPVRGVIQISEWLAQDYGALLPDEGHEMLDLLSRRAHRIHYLLDGLLKYIKIGRHTYKTEPVNLDELVAEVVDALSLPDHIQVVIVPHLPEVTGVKKYFRLVFENLLTNACAFMDKVDGQVKIASRDGGVYWEFSVSDNGPGIDAAYFNKIFQIFQTLVPRDELERSGVGLAVVKRIVETWGGKVWVESIVGEGSTFFFTYPKEGD